MALGREISFAKQEIHLIDDINISKVNAVDNMIIEVKENELKWIEDTSKVIGKWRDLFRSTYIRWALTINGLCVANEKYSSPEWKKGRLFNIKSLRVSKDIGAHQAIIAEWDGKHAAEAHKETINMIAAWGIIDLYSCVEKFIFDIYIIYLNRKPEILMQGREFKELRSIYKDRGTNKEQWKLKWKERIDNWQRKKIYDKLSKVFISYSNETGIKEPSFYKLTTIETWAESIEGISILRNCLIHGTEEVPIELAKYSEKPYSVFPIFIEGEELVIDLRHIQGVECFLNQLLTALNISIMEIYMEHLE